jgi:hypothetical protein
MLETARRTLVLVGAIVSSCVIVAQAQAPADQPKPLSRIARVVAIAEVSAADDVRQAMPTEQRLKTLTELRLRSAGLLVLSRDEIIARDPEIYPLVEVSVIAMAPKLKDGRPVGFAFRMDLKVQEYRVTPRNGAPVPMVLWSRANIMVTDRPDLSHSMERNLNEMLDDLVNEWLAANPRKGPS